VIDTKVSRWEHKVLLSLSSVYVQVIVKVVIG
jgi:hypothetical protein